MSKNKIYITFDIEWSHDEVLSECIDLCEEYRVRATFFATHDTPLLDRIRANPNFELGIHPNFNPLLEKSDSATDAVTSIDGLKKIVPEAKAIRSHSLVQSSRLLDLFHEYGFTHDVNTFIPFQSNIELKPWTDWNHTIRVPFYWEDDLNCHFQEDWQVKKVLKRPGLRVFNFHPIHIFLNSTDMTNYESSRRYHNTPEKLREYVSSVECGGTRRFLLDLFHQASEVGLDYGLINEISLLSY